MSITRQHSKSDSSYHLGADMLTQGDSYPYLGVTTSSDLKWHNHISHITAKASGTLGFIWHNVYNCPPEVKSLAYSSFIRPELEYASTSWYPYLVGDIQQLEKVQHRATRFVLQLQVHYLCYWSPGVPRMATRPLLSTSHTNSIVKLVILIL